MGMGSTAKRLDGKFTYEDYKTWPDEERWEVIDGGAYCMTPAPSLQHQKISGNFYSAFREFLKNKPCRPFYAPTDVVLDEANIVQPDVLVVCDPKKMEGLNILGAPDLVVEILSPSTRLKDKRDKKALYERFGVREYLIVYPEEEMVELFYLHDGLYASDVFNWDEKMVSRAFPELTVNLWEIFEKEVPQAEQSSDIAEP